MEVVKPIYFRFNDHAESFERDVQSSGIKVAYEAKLVKIFIRRHIMKDFRNSETE